MTRIATSLRRLQPRTRPMSDGELRALAARVWHQFGIVCLKPEDLPNPFDRQAAINVATKLYGARRGE